MRTTFAKLVCQTLQLSAADGIVSCRRCGAGGGE